jgi:signal transduction histidine kinase/DNA-binding response OmpR family regulator
MQTLGDLQGDILDAESAMRGLLLTGRAEFRGPYEDAARRVAADLSALGSVEHENVAQAARAAILADSVRNKLALSNRMLGLYDAGRAAAARDTVAAGGGARLASSIRLQVSRLMRAERTLLDQRLEDEKSEQQMATTIVLFGFLVACVVAGLAVVTIRRDMVERARLDADVASALAQAHAASKAKSDFLARMSHELRTPLNSVIGFANVLLKNGRQTLDDQSRAYIQRIRDNGTHLLEIINDILDLSKVESGRMDLVLETVDVARLLTETVSQFATRGVEAPPIEVDVWPGVAPLRTDPDKLRQVLLNLISNAAKFTSQGRIVVRGVADARSGELQRIDVIDTGVGIAADRLERIFEAFEQADASVQRRFGGTGLGLAISRSMCERLGYRLTVVSTPDAGSTFSIVTDPRAPLLARHEGPGPVGGRPAEPVPRRPRPAVPVDSPTVLVVDDSDDSRVLLTQLIEESGCRVFTAASGEGGVSAALDHRPDLIVLDLLMPEMDGRETLQRIRAHPSIARIPVIVVSAVAGDYQSRLPGAVELLSKPIDRDALHEAIDRALHASPARVLIVEDSDDARSLLEAHLAEFPGLAVESAPSALDALAKLQAFPADLILLDLVLPGMDGAEFLKRIRRIERYRDTPVVVITAKTLTRDERRTLERSAVTVLQKGDELGADLARVLRSVLRQIRSPAAP